MCGMLRRRLSLSKHRVFVVFCLELQFSPRQKRQERLILRNLRDLYTLRN